MGEARGTRGRRPRSAPGNTRCSSGCSRWPIGATSFSRSDLVRAAVSFSASSRQARPSSSSRRVLDPRQRQRARRPRPAARPSSSAPASRNATSRSRISASSRRRSPSNAASSRSAMRQTLAQAIGVAGLQLAPELLVRSSAPPVPLRRSREGSGQSLVGDAARARPPVAATTSVAPSPADDLLAPQPRRLGSPRLRRARRAPQPGAPPRSRPELRNRRRRGGLLASRAVGSSQLPPVGTQRSRFAASSASRSASNCASASTERAANACSTRLQVDVQRGAARPRPSRRRSSAASASARLAAPMHRQSRPPAPSRRAAQPLPAAAQDPRRPASPTSRPKPSSSSSVRSASRSGSAGSTAGPSTPDRAGLHRHETRAGSPPRPCRAAAVSRSWWRVLHRRQPFWRSRDCPPGHACARCIASPRQSRHRARPAQPLDLGSQPRDGRQRCTSAFARRRSRWSAAASGLGFAAAPPPRPGAARSSSCSAAARRADRFAPAGEPRSTSSIELAPAALLRLDRARARPLPTSAPRRPARRGAPDSASSRQLAASRRASRAPGRPDPARSADAARRAAAPVGRPGRRTRGAWLPGASCSASSARTCRWRP